METWDDESYLYPNTCEICGEPIEKRFKYCYQHAFDKCSCGVPKKKEFELCGICTRKTSYQKKRAIGFGFCPICGKEFLYSEYLETAIGNPKTRLIANLITHYRHVHQSSWDSTWVYLSCKYGEIAYQNAKAEYNNRAKRQILRKCQEWIKVKGIVKEDFLELQDNDDKTLALIDKIFGATHRQQ